MTPFRGKLNDPLRLKNASNSIHEGLYDSFKKKILQDFLNKKMNYQKPSFSKQTSIDDFGRLGAMD